MKMCCYVPFCQTTTSNAKSIGLTFHSLPENTYYRMKWIELFEHEGVKLTDDAVVCSKHFLCSDFVSTCSEVRRLKANAIPLIVKVCIICLDTERKLLPMTQYNLITAYENLTGLLLGYDSKLPQTICFECAQRLDNFSKFRDKSLRAVTLMVEIMKDHELLSMQNIRYVDRKANKLISNIGQTVFAPNHCDLYLCNSFKEKALFDDTNSSENIKDDDPIFVCDDTRQDIECNNDDNSGNNTNQGLLSTNSSKELNTSVGSYQRTITKLRNDVKKEINDFASKSEDEETYNVEDNDDSDTNSSHFDHIHIDNISNGLDDESDNVRDENNDAEVDYDKVVTIVWRQPRDTNVESKTEEVNNKNNDRDEKVQLFDTDNNVDVKTEIPADDNASDMSLETTPYNYSDDDMIFQTSESPHDQIKQNVIDKSIFKCAVCLKAFWDEDACNIHTRRHHKIDHSHVKLRVEKPQIVDSAPRIVTGILAVVSTPQIIKGKILNPVSEDINEKSKINRVIQIDSGKISGTVKQREEKQLTKKHDEKNHSETIKQKSDHTKINNIDKQLKKVQNDVKSVDLDTHVTQNNGLKDFNVPTAQSDSLVNKINYAKQNSATVQCRSSGVANISVPNSKSKLEPNNTNNGECLDKVTLNTPLISNTNEKFFCAYCVRNFSSAGNLQRHMKAHTGEKPHRCQSCDYKYIQRQPLLVHRRTHTAEKPFPCPMFPYRSTDCGHLLVHSQSHTNSKASSEHLVFSCDRRGENICGVCAKSFILPAHLDIHMSCHTGEKSYDCEFCEKSFLQKCALVCHRRTHTGEKPFSCNKCKYRCTTKGNLQRHMKTHTGVKLYSYDACDAKCLQQGSFKCHMRTHTGEKSLVCNICGKGFTDHRGLLRHVLTHRLQNSRKT